MEAYLERVSSFEKVTQNGKIVCSEILDLIIRELNRFRQLELGDSDLIKEAANCRILLEIIRNCSSNYECKKIFLDSDVFKNQVIPIIRKSLSRTRQCDGPVKSQLEDLIRVGLQALHNFTSGDSKEFFILDIVCMCVWMNIWSIFSEIIRQKTSDSSDGSLDSFLEIFLGISFNCVKNGTVFLDKMVIDLTTDSIGEEFLPSMIDVFHNNPSASEDSIHWFYLLIKEFTLKKFIIQKALKNNEKIKKFPVRKLALLHIIQSILEDSFKGEISSPGQLEKRVVNYFLSTFLEYGKRKRINSKELKVFNDLIHCSLSMLSLLPQHIDPSRYSSLSALISTHLQLIRERESKLTHGELKISRRAQNEDDPYFGLRSEFIRLVGAIAAVSPEFRKIWGEAGGVEELLNHLIVDENSPMLREWTIFAIRNVTDSNLENQKRIQDLKLQGLANSEELKSEFNIDASLDVGTGKVNFMRCDDLSNCSNE